MTAALGAAVPLMLTAGLSQIPGVNGIPKAMRNAIETARATPLRLVRAAVDKVVGKAEKWLGAMGGKGGTEGWVGVKDFAPPPGGTAYRLAVKVDGGSGKVTVLRSVVGAANSQQEFNAAADIQGITGDARRDIVALLARIEADAKVALAKSVAARAQAPVLAGSKEAAKPVTAEAKELAAALAKLTGDLTAALELLVKNHAACFFGRACFAAGTPLRTPGGWAAIESLAVGDLVLSRDEHDPAGPVSAKVVEEVFERFAGTYDLELAGGRVVRTTGEHPFHVVGRGWTPAHELAAGDRLSACDGSGVAVVGVRATGEWERVYNLRVADHHTYFVGDAEWGVSVWAHNQYFYHATSDEAAQSILASGVSLTSAKPRQDFGKAFYTTTEEQQARTWATQRFPGHGAVLKFNVGATELGALTVLSFADTTPEWQQTVWRGRRGILDTQPLDADLVIGPFLTNPGAMKESGTSAFDARGRGDQQGWLTGRAFTVLQHVKPIVI